MNLRGVGWLRVVSVVMGVIIVIVISLIVSQIYESKHGGGSYEFLKGNGDIPGIKPFSYDAPTEQTAQPEIDQTNKIKTNPVIDTDLATGDESSSTYSSSSNSSSSSSSSGYSGSSGSSNSSEEVNNLQNSCENYRYGNCPSGCIERCISSSCSDGRCTDDCNGVGSCHTPSVCEKSLSELNDEISLINHCDKDSDCAYEALFGGNCFGAYYNVAADLTKYRMIVANYPAACFEQYAICSASRPPCGLSLKCLSGKCIMWANQC